MKRPDFPRAAKSVSFCPLSTPVESPFFDAELFVANRADRRRLRPSCGRSRLWRGGSRDRPGGLSEEVAGRREHLRRRPRLQRHAGRGDGPHEGLRGRNESPGRPRFRCQSGGSVKSVCVLKRVDSPDDRRTRCPSIRSDCDARPPQPQRFATGPASRDSRASSFHEDGVWESLGIRLAWDQEIAGSNPAAPTRRNGL